MTISKICAALALVLQLAMAGQAGAQTATPPVSDMTTGLLTWVKHLNNDVDKYYKPEKGEDLSRHLGDLKEDLQVYMKTRKKLSDSLFRHNIAPGKKDPDRLEDLKTKMSAVMNHMRDVSDLVSNDLRKEGDKLNEDMYEALYGQQPRYLSFLEAFLDGVEVTKKDLAVDGSVHYQRLEECIAQIASLKDKIDRKTKK
ncbi:hypothetical protein HF329_10540 [Chitinophaga oryzae]|uniref:DUF4142 domain-containing protein n=1 Tax=Chitinophaga oryzae TaxID=2725414 RepID=A0AAE6ZHV0_9BACT|nr:hypothetical protein [Chitinophaga oryzae]QJB31729.1 hypothetical protein HF329_10540 [Chitinophaga oryzae]